MSNRKNSILGFYHLIVDNLFYFFFSIVTGELKISLIKWLHILEVLWKLRVDLENRVWNVVEDIVFEKVKCILFNGILNKTCHSHKPWISIRYTHHRYFLLRRSLTCGRHIIIILQLQWNCYLSEYDKKTW